MVGLLRHLCGHLVRHLLLLLLFLLHQVRIVIQCLVEFQLLHLFSILDLLILGNTVLRQLLTEEAVISEVRVRFRILSLDGAAGLQGLGAWIVGLQCAVLGARALQRRTLNERFTSICSCCTSASRSVGEAHIRVSCVLA